MEKNKKKLLIFNTLYPPQVIGGAELSVQSIAESVKDSFDVTVTCSSDTNKKSEYYLNNVHIIKIPSLNLGYRSNRTKNFVGKIFWNILEIWNPLKNLYLNNIIKEINPDIIHTHNLACLSAYVWKIGKEKNIPVIHTLRDKWLLCSRHHMFKDQITCRDRCTFCKLLDYNKKKYSQNVDCVIGISNFILNLHIKNGYFFKSDKKVIYNAVNISIKKNTTRKENQLIFGFLGTIAPYKGIEFLLKNFLQTENKASLYIGGFVDNSYSQNLKKKYGSERVKFLGRVAPKDFLGKIDVLIVPSLVEEAFGRVVIEAFQCGIPVLASNRGGLLEIIKDNITGWFFDPTIEKDLISKIKHIIHTKDLELYKHNCLAEGEKFKINIMKENYLNVYKKYLNF